MSSNFNNGLIIGSLLGLTVIQLSGAQFEIICFLNDFEEVETELAEYEIAVVNAPMELLSVMLEQLLLAEIPLELSPFEIVETLIITEFSVDLFDMNFYTLAVDSAEEIETTRLETNLITVEVIL